MKTKEIKNHISPTAYDDAVFEWYAPEYIHHEKGDLWKWMVGGIWVLLILFALFQNSWTFAIALLIFGGVYGVIYHEKPKHMHVKISRVGIKMGNISIPYSHIRAFWIHYEPPFLNQMHIRIGSRFTPDYVISLEDQNPAEIREYLVTQISEWEGKQQALSDVLIRIFKL